MIYPVTLPNYNNRSSLDFKISNATYYYATGYILYDHVPVIPQIEDGLQFLPMKIVDLQDCAKRLAVKMDKSRICVRGVDIHNDEHAQGALCTEFGVPLVYNTTLIGIFDYTDSKCTVGGPNLFIKIESFVNWIKLH